MSGLRRRLLIVFTVLVLLATGALVGLVAPLRTDWIIFVVVQAVVMVVGWATIYLATVAPSAPLAELAESLRALSIGQRSIRLDPEQFGLLADAARAANELAASLSEGQDPNLGAVRRRRRTDGATPRRNPPSDVAKPPPARAPVVPKKREGRPSALEPEGLGEVRKIPKPAKAKAAPKPAPEKNAAAAPEAEASRDDPATPVVAKSATPPPSTESDTASAAPTPSADAPAPASTTRSKGKKKRRRLQKRRGASGEGAPVDGSSAPSKSADTVVDEPDEVDAAPKGPGLEEFRALYDAFAAAQDASSTVPSFEEFAQALAAQKESLIEQHGCRDVRFDLKSQNGEVSFQPRLVR